MTPSFKRILSVIGLTSVALFLNNTTPVSASSTPLNTEALIAEDDYSAEIEFGDIQEKISQTIETTKEEFGADSFDFWQTGEFETTKLNIRTVNSQVVSAFEDLAHMLDLPLDIVLTEPLSGVAMDILESSELATISQQSGVVGTSFNVIDGEIIIDVDQTSKEQPTLKSALVAGKSLSTRQSEERVATTRRIPITINYVGQTSDAANVRGGSAMAACTTGFSATLGTTEGFTSADHCGPTMQYWNTPTATGKALGTSTRTHSSNRQKADIAFWPVATHTSVPYFWGTSASTLLRADKIINPYVGLRVCHRGIASGMKCGNIASISYKPTWDDACPRTGCYNTFVSLRATQAGGDSGGPWFTGRHPVGIHKGGSSTLSVFSSLAYSPATVMVEP